MFITTASQCFFSNYFVKKAGYRCRHDFRIMYRLEQLMSTPATLHERLLAIYYWLFLDDDADDTFSCRLPAYFVLHHISFTVVLFHEWSAHISRNAFYIRQFTISITWVCRQCRFINVAYHCFQNDAFQVAFRMPFDDIDD